MITTRRSFVKGLSAVVGAIPLPGMVKRLASTLVPEEQTLEDAEDILRGLIARCVNGPIDEKEAGLIASFLTRMRPTDEQIDAMLEIQGSYRPGTESEEMKQLKAKLPYSLRFITATVKGMRPKKWFAENFKKLNKPVMPLVVEPFNCAKAKEHFAKQVAKRNA
jgi:hypothetical protein